eukprot:gnl/TRDRNA2_/TRDRNA2_187473_c0_seq1.p1 gnl/TRDRNA2_/TRDRNA2_187473_c0~~gnl/TRDRNA2_/TRDRNA2_187473_c0_seq1.p1  ORF type:complete len:164 (-),score=20.85 gnl/TRDRNA2_/TRDRNA2_187473_c0_seq1:73-564(-)
MVQPCARRILTIPLLVALLCTACCTLSGCMGRSSTTQYGTTCKMSHNGVTASMECSDKSHVFIATHSGRGTDDAGNAGYHLKNCRVISPLYVTCPANKEVDEDYVMKYRTDCGDHSGLDKFCRRRRSLDEAMDELSESPSNATLTLASLTRHTRSPHASLRSV